MITCHDIAVFLYQLDNGTHKHAEWETWHKEKLELLAEQDPQNIRTHRFKYGPPTPFYRIGYMFWKKYPNGLADVAGYWAEHHIFGGVVLFDRGESEEEVSKMTLMQVLSLSWSLSSNLLQCNGIYIHHPEATLTLTPPTEKQFNNLVDFLLSTPSDKSPPSDKNPSRCPLPVHITAENKWRWHPYDGMVDYHIYKFRHEIPTGARPRDHCDIGIKDWPEANEQQIIETEGIKSLEEDEVYDEGLVAACWDRLKRTATPTSRCYCWNDEEQSRLQPDPKKRGRPPYFFDP